MFWRKTPSVEPAPAPPPAAAASNEDLEEAIDGAGSILRALSKHAFAVDEETKESIAASFERFASHVLVLAPLEGQKTTDGKAPRRHWPSVVRFVTDRRKREQAFVERTTKEAREAIQALVEGVGRACLEHGRVDAPLRAQATRLRDAAATDSISDLKREATEFASTVVEYLEAQNQRLSEQTRDLRERLSKLEVELDDARKEGGTDPLTKLANRRTFDTTIERQITYTTVLGRPLCLVMVDIDRFKSINDRHGHPVGDQVICAVSNCLAKAFPRRSDLVARYGGEEFACVLPETSLENARTLAERMTAAIRGLTIETASERFKVTVSAGVTVLGSGEGVAELVARADQALYAAKEGGRDRVVVAGEAALKRAG